MRIVAIPIPTSIPSLIITVSFFLLFFLFFLLLSYLDDKYNVIPFTDEDKKTGMLGLLAFLHVAYVFLKLL
ncbi:MAG: hypothetical protein E4G94_11815 [ANME-2 cluster archaeon]|nr:MAG: hypothetical protein E4G94_11815 [ANME-2 cluster archaeon]